MPSIHEPVLLSETLSFLNPQPGKNFIDGTFGGGGHALAILEKIKPSGKLLGIDWDRKVVQNSQAQNLILVNGNYRELKKIYQQAKDEYDLGKISGIILDLGLSSDQLIDEERGFSFNSCQPLDMRFDTSDDRSRAADILLRAGAEELIRIFKEYGEEPLAQPIARAVIARRKKGEDIQSATMLVRLISDIYRQRYHRPSKRNPATRVMQALRIAVNDEFGNIRKVLPQAVELLEKGGRLAVISFHSGEDRIVKNFFRDWSKGDGARLKVLTKKPIVASAREVKSNPRSRSAKLRVVEKIN